MLWTLRKGCRLFKGFEILLVCIVRTTIFLTFTFPPPLCKAIWISAKLHLSQLMRLVALKYGCHDFATTGFALEGQELSWLDKMLFHHLMSCHTQLNSWHSTHNIISHKTLNITDDIVTIRSWIFDRDVEAIQAHLLRAIIAYFVKYLLLPIARLQLHFAEMQYALSWTLYQMVFRPPLAFLYLLSTIANEFSWYLDSLVNHLTSEKRKKVPIDDAKTAVCPNIDEINLGEIQVEMKTAVRHNIDEINLGDIQAEMNYISEAIAQGQVQRALTKVSTQTGELKDRFRNHLTWVSSPNVSPIKNESLEVGDPLGLPYRENFCLEKFLESRFDENRDFSNQLPLVN